jgi:hypothetical protein
MPCIQKSRHSISSRFEKVMKQRDVCMSWVSQLKVVECIFIDCVFISLATFIKDILRKSSSAVTVLTL